MSFTQNVTALLFMSLPAHAAGLDKLVQDAVSDDTAKAKAAIAELRTHGQPAVDAFLQKFPSPNSTTNGVKALEGICRQKDCYSSGLFWHTDIESAKAQAKAEGKPILSLRLLGNLDDELSCANSRFFRTILYPVPEIASLLRGKYVLHWKSVRPVPVMTIDYGDGRRLQQTITGNSIHYILDSQGRVVDALPGLYAPAVFRNELARLVPVAKRLAKLSDAQWDNAAQKFHSEEGVRRYQEWAKDAELAGMKGAAMMRLVSYRPKREGGRLAAELSMSKMAVERPATRQLSPDDESSEALEFRNTLDNPIWTRMSQAKRAELALGPASMERVVEKYLKGSKQFEAQPEAEKMLARLQWSIGIDTVRNEYLLRSAINTWLNSGARGRSLDVLNEDIYADLFLTPSTDPWLGLGSPGLFTGLPANTSVAPGVTAQR